jgi:hypothetical protein
VKKILGMCLIVLLVSSLSANCLAFPALGAYESMEKDNIPQGENATTAARYNFVVDKTENKFFGTFNELRSGGIKGEWSAPLSIMKNNEGRYVIECIFDNGASKFNGLREIEEITDISFKMYSGQTDKDKVVVGVFLKIK